MALDIAAVQAALRENALDGWLLYDFHGSNPIARRLAGLSADVMATRRWYYFIPAGGSPTALVHAIERHNLDDLPGRKQIYAEREQLQAGLQSMLAQTRRIAMEFSPDCAIPYISRVDGGTLDLIRSLGVSVVSSGDLVQRFEACWTDEQLATHRQASARLYEIKDRAFEAIAKAVRDHGQVSELDIQQQMVGWFSDLALVSDSPPVVAAAENAGNPHYLPRPGKHRAIRANEVVLLDLWGKLAGADTVYADITWVGFTGKQPPSDRIRAFEGVRAARDAAVDLIEARATARRELRGFEVDRAAREVLEAAGFKAAMMHRTGHSLGAEVHGTGVHLDDYETHDDRRLLPGTAVTVEPGLYFADFGVRTEINIYFGDGFAEVTGQCQQEIVALA